MSGTHIHTLHMVIVPVVNCLLNVHLNCIECQSPHIHVHNNTFPKPLGLVLILCLHRFYPFF